MYLGNELGADVNHRLPVIGATPVFVAAENGHLDVVVCLAKVLGANISLPLVDGATPIFIAAQNGHLAVVMCLGTGLGADVNPAKIDGATPLLIAAEKGNIDVVRFLVKELGADVNLAKKGGYTPLMAAAHCTDQPIIKHLVHNGAHVRAVSTHGTAAEILRKAGGSSAQIAYLNVRECCANPGCEGGGRKRCAVCKETRYCGMACRVAHWRVHRVGCRPPIVQESEGSEVASCGVLSTVPSSDGSSAAGHVL
jgi:ankyrin repeat protein